MPTVCGSSAHDDLRSETEPGSQCQSLSTREAGGMSEKEGLDSPKMPLMMMGPPPMPPLETSGDEIGEENSPLYMAKACTLG